MSRKTISRVALVSGALGALIGAASPAAAQGEPTVIDLTQTACQFVESENGMDHGYTTASASDCRTINQESGEARLAKAESLHLKPGSYIFRVTNKNVPYELGFWLRGAGLVGRATLPSVSGGGLTTGTTQDYRVELTEGEYLYSCPLNPTPDYKIVVDG